jgi:hypothetical protein
MIFYEPNDPCPCDSGKTAQRCCLSLGIWYKEPVQFKAGGGIPGYKNPRCYAQELGNCERKISAEHFISNSILSFIAKPLLTVQKTRWLKEGEKRQVGTDSLKSKILCTRHNSMLAGLDAQAGRFFRAIEKLSSWVMEPSRTKAKDIYLFSGYDIERWLLKSLFGSLASRNVVVGGQVLEPNCLDPVWLRVLFGEREVLTGCGLWTIWTEPETHTVPLGIELESIRSTTLTPPLLHGIRATLIHLTLAVYLYPITNDDPKAQLSRRPLKLTFMSGAEKKYIWLTWRVGTVVTDEVGYQFPQPVA